MVEPTCFPLPRPSKRSLLQSRNGRGRGAGGEEFHKRKRSDFRFCTPLTPNPSPPPRSLGSLSLLARRGRGEQVGSTIRGIVSRALLYHEDLRLCPWIRLNWKA